MKKLLRNEEYLLELEFECLVMENDPWSPYFNSDQAQILYEAQKALISCDIDRAKLYGRLYKLVPADDLTAN